MSVPASEIIREAEKQLIEANKLRLAAFELLQKATASEDLARSVTVEALGPERGLLAFEMAQWSISALSGTDIPQDKHVIKELVDTSNPKNSQQKYGAGKENNTPSPSINVVESKKVSSRPSVKQLDVSRYFGEKVPLDRVSEADDIVSQAASFVAQGRKGNPYGSDRGKNAWRKSLFNAAYNHLALNQETHVPETTETVDNTSATDLKDNPDMGDVTHPDAGVNIPYVIDVDHQGEYDDLNEELANEASLDDDIHITDFDAVEDDFLDDDVLENDPESYDEYSYANSNVETDDPSGHSSLDYEPSEDEDTSQQIEDIENSTPVLDTAESASSSPSDIDPFDDIGDLPPENPSPPPRGFSSVKPANGTSTVSNMGMRPISRVANINDGFAKPVKVESKPFNEVAELKHGLSDFSDENHENLASADTEISATPVAHTPRPVPSYRRPGNGQVLQQPTTLPSALANSKPVIADKPKSKSFSSPPSFMSRKA